MLAACGGGGGSSGTASGGGSASTTVSGSVVKGPVNGAQVCAYAVAGSARGAAVGSCTTTSATGTYSFSVPVGTGPLWVEATGGTYTDEATSTTVTLPAGSPLVNLISANGGAVTSMLTPLTTLALNAARATVGSSGTLDAAAFGAAATQLLSTFNLPSTLDITTTLPGFGSSINSYGTALTAISQMVANGSTLASILATTSPSTLAAAYAAAAAGDGGGGGGGGGDPTVGSPTASGTLTVAGVTAPGAATSLTPRADGFQVALENGGVTKYHFFSAPLGSASQVDVTVAVAITGAISVAYNDVASSTYTFCSSNCGVTITTASGTTHPVTVAFANTPLGSGRSLNGSLVGDAPGAAWVFADLPGASSGSLTVGGASVGLLTVDDSVSDTGNGNTVRIILVRLSDGSSLLLNKTGSLAFTVSRVVSGTIKNCSLNCGITVADGVGTRITFANTALDGGPVLDGTVDYVRTTGSLTSNDSIGGITPVASNIESLNAVRSLTFSVLGTSAQAGVSIVTVDVVAGRVTQAQATVGIGAQVLSCFDNGTGIGIPACSGITVADDGRTVTFTNAVLRGGAVGVAARNVTFNGTVAAKGP